MAAIRRRPSRALLNQPDGVAVRVCNPCEAEVRQEVVRRAERGRTFAGQACVIAVHIVRPKHELDRPTTERAVGPLPWGSKQLTTLKRPGSRDCGGYWVMASMAGVV